MRFFKVKELSYKNSKVDYDQVFGIIQRAWDDDVQSLHDCQFYDTLKQLVLALTDSD